MSDMAGLDEGQAVSYLVERIADLELALEDRRWMRLAGEFELEFSRDGLRQINAIARIMYLKNPLIQRGVNVQAYYVFGQGVTLRGEDEAVNKVVQAFLNDHRNRAELTTQKALTAKEKDLTLFGNLLFVFFTNPITGRVRVRSISVDEVDEIICNPDDAKEPWLYHRRWMETRMNNGVQDVRSREAYYPDWRYQPRSKQAQIGSVAVHWGEPVYHVKVGGLSDMRFGVSEVYAAIDWAIAYKQFLEDWATIVRSLSRFAWKLTGPGSKSSITAAKARLSTTVGADGDESNPSPGTGSVFIGKPGYELTPIPKSGATVSAEDGRRLMLQVAAVMGLPETFFGDVSVGTLATANSLDRPTELKFKDRQSTWADVLIDIATFVVQKAATAPRGMLSGVVKVVEDEDGTPRMTLPNGDEVVIRATFPPILEHDVAETVGAVTSAASVNVIDTETIARMLLTALGEQDVDAALERIAEETERKAKLAAEIAKGEKKAKGEPEEEESGEVMSQTERRLAEAARELREAIQEMKKK